LSTTRQKSSFCQQKRSFVPMLLIIVISTHLLRTQNIGRHMRAK
jgi:hypothetical protein